MIKGRDFVIVLCILFLLLYSVLGDSSDNYWSFGWFTSLYLIIFKAIDQHRNKYLRIGIKLYTVLMILYAFLTCVLNIEIEYVYTTVIFIPLFITISILISRNNVYKQGFFR
jgi:hypothetical protein